jgi:hypothetical protein
MNERQTASSEDPRCETVDELERCETVDELEQREDVREALQQVGPKPEKPPVKPLHLAWIATYLLILAGLAVVLYLLRFDVVRLTPRMAAFAQRITLGAMAVVGVLGVVKAVDALILQRLENRVTEFNLRRIVRAIAALAILVVIASILSASWYTALVSLGVLSLILGFLTTALERLNAEPDRVLFPKSNLR